MYIYIVICKGQLTWIENRTFVEYLQARTYAVRYASKTINTTALYLFQEGQAYIDGNHGHLHAIAYMPL